jgi:hypothetical protein
MPSARWIALVTLVAALALPGCLAVHGPPIGLLCTYAQGPVAVASDAPLADPKVGRAESHSALLFTYGDASIAAAMKQGGITRVHHVDYEVKSLFGVFTEFTTVVYGE